MSKGKVESPDSIQLDHAMVEKKRKRSKGDPEDELEIDVNLPEPPSKKAKRKEKKAEKQKTKKPSQTSEAKVEVTSASNGDEGKNANAPAPTPKQRTDHGIWIGNLPFTVSKDDLRRFLDSEGGISDDDVVRIHLPTPKDAGRKFDKNRGFAYIDFATQDILDKALLLTEKLLSGRRVLIKNAKSFEGRPPKAEEGKSQANDGSGKAKEPSKRIFVGNLGFDVTREELAEHFSQAGEVEDVFLATFEDSGKCKGFGWVRFAAVEGAEAAVRGFIFRDAKAKDGDVSDSEDGGVEIVTDKSQVKAKKEKRRKWFINRLLGRELRCEFAEDANTRYKKRFGKEGKAVGKKDGSGAPITEISTRVEGSSGGGKDQDRGAAPRKPQRNPHMNQDDRREERRKRHEKMDARRIAPGQALAGTQRASAAIVAGAGKKISFD
jgi:RNA recognition motif-containing protein